MDFRTQTLIKPYICKYMDICKYSLSFCSSSNMPLLIHVVVVVFPSQGVLGKTTAVQRSAASPSRGSKELSERSPWICMRRGAADDCVYVKSPRCRRNKQLFIHSISCGERQGKGASPPLSLSPPATRPSLGSRFWMSAPPLCSVLCSD